RGQLARLPPRTPHGHRPGRHRRHDRRRHVHADDLHDRRALQVNDSRRSIPARAFTLVELLVAVFVIVLLLGILIPASTLVLSRSREASNRALLQTLADGAYAFNQDFRYYPPLLAPDPSDPTRMYAPDHTVEPPVPGGRTAAERYDDLRDIRWHSVVTPAVYLLGVGSLAPTGGDQPWVNPNDPNYENRHDGAEGLGIRNPGPDRSWGGAVSRDNHRPTFAARVYGPYVDPKIGETQVRPVRLTDFTYRSDLTPPLSQSHIDMMGLSVIVDRFDEPIRYYKDWPER